MKTRELQTLWWDWLGSSERLMKTLHEQTAALTLRDVARLERVQPDVDLMLERVKGIDDRAAAIARKLAEELGTEPNLRSLANALDTAEAQQVTSLANKVLVAARNLQNLLDRNRQLIESELTYVNGTLTLIAKASTEAKGPYAEGKAAVAAVLVDQAA